MAAFAKSWRRECPPINRDSHVFSAPCLSGPFSTHKITRKRGEHPTSWDQWPPDRPLSDHASRRRGSHPAKKAFHSERLWIGSSQTKPGEWNWSHQPTRTPARPPAPPPFAP